MEMRPGGFSRVAGLTEEVSPLDLHSLLHIDGAEVGIAGLVAEAVIHEDIAAEAPPGVVYGHFLHDPVASGIDRIADLNGEVQAVVPCLSSVNRVGSHTETA